MRRRDFMTLIGSTAAMLPTGLLAQENVPAIGFMSSRAPGDSSRLVNSFLRGLASLGFFAGQNVKIEYRWAEGEYEHYPPSHAAWLIRTSPSSLLSAALPLQARQSLWPGPFPWCFP